MSAHIVPPRDRTPDDPVPPGDPLRICIVTPGQVGSNPRAVKEAQVLRAAGHAVTLIATRVLDLDEARDQAVIAQAGFAIRRIDLRRGPAWKARRALQILAGRLHAASGWMGAAILGHSAATPALIRAACAVPADLYIAHYPAALPAAAAAARRHGGALAYDAEDFHLGDWPDGPAHARVRNHVRAVEGRFLPACAFVTAASPGIADAYAAAYGVARPQVILNAFPLAQGAPAPTARGSAEPAPSLYWFSRTIGPDRGLECALRAVAAARTRPHLYLRGTPAAGFAEALGALARSLGLADRLHLLAPEAPDAMERLAAAYDLGLCGEPGHTRNNGLALSNKLFSYLAAGVPPVLSATPAQRAFAAETGLSDHLYPIDDHAALAARLDGLLGDPGRLAAARDAAWRLGRERFNWEREGAPLPRLAAEACHGRR
ncbi:Glycosyltransferase involved in cell wall bisynthesis [Methylobacterium sp. 174MFSha1.1]|uniref:glycosyltransferase n=1 Tax=Methylobacterium sp. 174MFSha1.1 TaxID=1502749 RepID=UPI0008F3828F|nr:glycosyltransferase [Methylobacterium sp. 174MFSha1.1]SFU47272.1 Glycosyltransferase involved in cell wall bisynthesis [Methylobacterium sp. 174MFSha1.1]